MLTLPINVEVYRYLALSPAYRIYLKIYRFSTKYVPCFDVFFLSYQPVADKTKKFRMLTFDMNSLTDLSTSSSPMPRGFLMLMAGIS